MYSVRKSVYFLSFPVVLFFKCNTFSCRCVSFVQNPHGSARNLRGRSLPEKSALPAGKSGMAERSCSPHPSPFPRRDSPCPARPPPVPRCRRIPLRSAPSFLADLCFCLLVTGFAVRRPPVPGQGAPPLRQAAPDKQTTAEPRTGSAVVCPAVCRAMSRTGGQNRTHLSPRFISCTKPTPQRGIPAFPGPLRGTKVCSYSGSKLPCPAR